MTDRRPSGPVRFERVELRFGRHDEAYELDPGAAARRAVRATAGRIVSNGSAGNGASGNGAGDGEADVDRSGDRRTDAGREAGALGRPFVILGPNGAGKSTLLDAPIRALYGFRRTKRDERDAYEGRRPWAGGPYRVALDLRTPAGRFRFERDLESDRVRVTRAGRESPLFDAEANPARSGESVRRYHALLEETIGLSELDDYRRTACIVQGELRETELGQSLLQVAAGGHADVEAARNRLREEYRELTVEPIGDDVSRRRKPGELEAVRDRIAELEAEEESAREAERRRAPLVRKRDELRESLGELTVEVDGLEHAFETLSERSRLEAEAEASRARIRALERAERELDEVLARFTLVTERADEDTAAPGYPDDFSERARLLEEALWPRAAEVRESLARLADAGSAAARGERGGAHRPASFEASDVVRRGGAVAGIVLTLLAVVLLVGGRTTGGLVTGLLGVAVSVGAVSSLRSAASRARERERRLAELRDEAAGIEERIAGLSRDLPDGESLTPQTLPAARREFERHVRERRLREESVRDLRTALDASARALADHAEALEAALGREEGARPDRHDFEGGAPSERVAAATLEDRARERLRALREAAGRERNERLAPVKLRLREIGRVTFDLPGDVDATLDAVRTGRRDRLARADRARAELSDVERALAGEGRTSRSRIAIQRDLAAVRERESALAARAEAYRRAYAFVTEAHEAFRQTDEERLLGAISRHVDTLSSGRLGPVETSEGLESPTVRRGERRLPLESPPLSFGQLHALLLAVRLGAADFLAGMGLEPPLLIDDPFVHLDERMAADLWLTLTRVAARRQVIVATQDRLVLQHLGIDPDLRLEPGTGTASDPTLGAEALPDGDPPARESQLLDLWGDPPE